MSHEENKARDHVMQPGEVVRLPLETLTFPHRCVRCGEPPDEELLIGRVHGLFLIFPVIGWFFRKSGVEVPICSRCSGRRRVLAGLVYVLLAMGTFSACVGLLVHTEEIAAAFGWSADDMIIYFVVAAVVLLVLVHWVVWWLPGRMDWMILGVQVLSLSKRKNRVKLRFKDTQLAGDVQQRTSEVRYVFTQKGKMLGDIKLDLRR